MHLIIAAILAAMIMAGAMRDADAGHTREAEAVTHSTVSCTSTTGQALATNAGRLAALFQNDGAEAIWIRIGEASVANEGIRLNALGGSYFMSHESVNMDVEAVNCITAAGTAVILVVEWDNN